MEKTDNHLSIINNHLAFGIFTLVERALQIAPFMQNEPNFRKSQMNVNKVLSKDYEKKTLGERGKNEPKTNPKRTQSKPKQSQFPIILVSLNWLCIISFFVMVT